MKFLSLAVAFIVPLAMLAACQHFSPSQALEQADTAASDAYALTATLANGAEAADPALTAKAEAIKLQAWTILQQERAAYAQGQSVAAFVTQLQALEAQAKGL